MISQDSARGSPSKRDDDGAGCDVVWRGSMAISISVLPIDPRSSR